jgi:hypothetical protein
MRLPQGPDNWVARQDNLTDIQISVEGAIFLGIRPPSADSTPGCLGKPINIHQHVSIMLKQGRFKTLGRLGPCFSTGYERHNQLRPSKACSTLSAHYRGRFQPRYQWPWRHLKPRGDVASAMRRCDGNLCARPSDICAPDTRAKARA